MVAPWKRETCNEKTLADGFWESVFFLSCMITVFIIPSMVSPQTNNNISNKLICMGGLSSCRLLMVELG